MLCLLPPSRRVSRSWTKRKTRYPPHPVSPACEATSLWTRCVEPLRAACVHSLRALIQAAWNMQVLSHKTPVQMLCWHMGNHLEVLAFSSWSKSKEVKVAKVKRTWKRRKCFATANVKLVAELSFEAAWPTFDSLPAGRLCRPCWTRMAREAKMSTCLVVGLRGNAVRMAQYPHQHGG